MNLTVWVDVAIGLSLVYLGVSLFVTIVNEYLAQLLNLRGRQLWGALAKLIADDKVRAVLGANPALRPFFGGRQEEAGSYVDPNVLARLLVGSLGAASGPATSVQMVSEAIDELPDSSLKIQLQALVSTAGGRMEGLVTAVSDWVDRSLTMLGDAYKRHLQKLSFAVGMAVAVALNVDTVAVATRLYQDKEARDASVALAVKLAEKDGKEAIEKCTKLKQAERPKDQTCAPMLGLLEAVEGKNASLGTLPIGWQGSRPRVEWKLDGASAWRLLTTVVGWLLTGLAISLGAPFWFDLLNKLVNVRHGMRKPEVQREGAGKGAS